jgi:hypothetical protein
MKASAGRAPSPPLASGGCPWSMGSLASLPSLPAGSQGLLLQLSLDLVFPLHLCPSILFFLGTPVIVLGPIIAIVTLLLLDCVCKDPLSK